MLPPVSRRARWAACCWVVALLHGRHSFPPAPSQLPSHLSLRLPWFNLASPGRLAGWQPLAAHSLLSLLPSSSQVQFGGSWFNTHPLDSREWAVCVGLGATTLGLREVLRRLPYGK